MKSTWKLMSACWLAPVVSSWAQAEEAAPAAPSAEMLTLAQLMQMGFPNRCPDLSENPGEMLFRRNLSPWEVSLPVQHRLQ